MLWYTRSLAQRGAGRGILAAALLVMGLSAPASAFVAAPAWFDPAAAHHAAHGGHHRHAPSGANVIGRGIGGLHGDLHREAAARAGMIR